MQTVKEIAEQTNNKQLAHLLEDKHLAIDPELSVDVAPQAAVKEQVTSVIETILQAVFESKELDETAKKSRALEIIAEILEADHKNESDEEIKTDEGLANQLEKLTEAVAQLNSENSARAVLESAGINASELDPENMKRLKSQKSEGEMKRLVESWPGYIKTPNHVFGRFTENDNRQSVTAPANGKELARQLR